MPTMVVTEITMDDEISYIEPKTNSSIDSETKDSTEKSLQKKQVSETATAVSNPPSQREASECKNNEQVIRRDVGPHEESYNKEYDPYVVSILSVNADNSTFEEQFQKYSILSLDEKNGLLKNVDDLLDRIKEEKTSENDETYKYVYNKFDFETGIYDEYLNQSISDEENEYLNYNQMKSFDTTLNESNCNDDTTMTNLNQSVSLLNSSDGYKSQDLMTQATATSPYKDLERNTRRSFTPILSQLKDITNQPFYSVQNDSKALKQRHSRRSKLKQNEMNRKNTSDIQTIGTAFQSLEIYNDHCNETSNESEILTDPEERSIEYFRGTQNIHKQNKSSTFSSPLIQNNNTCKRLASTSGKKGTDTQRIKRDMNCSKLQLSPQIYHDANYKELYENREHNSEKISEVMFSPSAAVPEIQSQVQVPFLDTQSPIECLRESVDVDIVSPPMFTMQSNLNSSVHSTRRTLQFETCLHLESQLQSRQKKVTIMKSQSNVNRKKKCVSFLHNAQISAQHDSIEQYMSEQQYQYRDKNQRDAFQVSHRLKKGVSFRMEPLLVRKQKRFGKEKDIELQDRKTKFNNVYNNAGKNQILSNQDPFSIFTDRTSSRLNSVVSWLIDQEMRPTQNCNNTSNSSDDSSRIVLDEIEFSKRGVIFSLSPSQINAVTLKSLQKILPTSSDSLKSICHEVGGTLIIARNKDDLRNWEVYFREQSSFSVLNHGSMSIMERKRISQSRYSGFDIVLSTFDALKAKEQTQALNERGHAIVVGQQHNSAARSIWYTSREKGDTQNCKQLSMLHRFVWCKVIFVDVLGRGCYLTKDTTARMIASKALIANSR